MTPQSSTAQTVGRFDVPIPRGLREQTAGMSWETVLATYSHSAGPVRLGHWECTDGERPATRLGPQARNYQATLAVDDRIDTSTAAASGPVAALTRCSTTGGSPSRWWPFTRFRPANTPRRSSAATTAPASSGRWGGRTIRRSRRCAR